MQPGSQHAHTRLKGKDFARVGAFALGEDEDGRAFRGQIARISQRFARACFALGKRESVEDQRRKHIVQAAGETIVQRVCLGMKWAAKNSFAIAGAVRYRHFAGSAENIAGTSKWLW